MMEHASVPSAGGVAHAPRDARRASMVGGPPEEARVGPGGAGGRRAPGAAPSSGHRGRYRLVVVPDFAAYPYEPVKRSRGTGRGHG